MSKKITVVGSYAAGLTMKTKRFPNPGETLIGQDYHYLHGGKGSNQAVACARNQLNVSFVCCVGNDVYGKQALQLFRDEKINVQHVVCIPDHSSGVGFIMVDHEGDNEILIDFGVNQLLTPQLIEEHSEAISDADMILLQMEIPIESVIHTIQKTHEYQKKLIWNPAPYQPLPEELFPQIYVVTPNRTEANLLLHLPVTDSVPPKVLGEALRKKGFANSVITLGADGCVVTSSNYSEILPAYSVDVVDSTGAGDTFTANLVAALVDGADLKEAAMYASAAAALAVTKYGVIESIPFQTQTTEFIKHCASA